ncbi:MAG: tetraacyldisaccharide 4'-kinase [Pseudomonadota bacterium]
MISGAFQQWLVKSWYQRAWWLILLRPLEVFYRLATAQRRGLYKKDIRKAYRASVPVVVVGNITVGGTGKTAVVISLIEELRERGLTVGVVSRGYGAVSALRPRRLDQYSTVEQVGDEPLQIFRRTAAPCAVAASRAEAARLLLKQCELDLIISDDGLQHPTLHRDLEIALLDNRRGIGNGFCLPAGPLREPVDRLWTVDFLLYRHGENEETAVRYIPQALINVASSEQRTPEAASLQASVHAVAGLGQPDQYFDFLRSLGFHPIEHAFPDHHKYEAKDLAHLDDLPVLMTEKDAVKCKDFAGANVWYLKIHAQLPPAVLDAVVTLARR